MDATEATPAQSVSASDIFRFIGVLILAVMLLVPIWTVAFPPLLDYPNHLARAFVLAHLNDSHFSFQQFYRAIGGAGVVTAMVRTVRTTIARQSEGHDRAAIPPILAR